MQLTLSFYIKIANIRLKLQTWARSCSECAYVSQYAVHVSNYDL